jgi:hypothetical protein
MDLDTPIPAHLREPVSRAVRRHASIVDRDGHDPTDARIARAHLHEMLGLAQSWIHDNPKAKS